MVFKHPICYLKKTKSLSDNCVNELELDILVNNLLHEKSSSNLRRSWLIYYTTNINYLKETQLLLKKIDNANLIDYKEVQLMWNNLKNNPSFREKFDYITIDKLKEYNKYELVLQAISIYSLASPILSLISPLILLLFPFFIIKLQGKTISISNYITHLKETIEHMPIGQILKISSASWDQKVFIIISIIFYFVNMYQNSITCYKFYKNTSVMVDTIKKIKNYFKETVKSIDLFQDKIKNSENYLDFSFSLKNYKLKMTEIYKKYDLISDKTFSNLGKKMKYFYDIYCDDELANCLNYSFEFNEYLQNLFTISKNKFLNQCKFTNKHSNIENSYYSLLDKDCAIKNTYTLKKNIIISGPNACGKTTLLKSTLFNLILSQKIGKGYYDNANIFPYDYFHCYINIPDTCARDSLFQAEVRRCKEILDHLEKYSDARHFCIFDELFSGTNPYEAVASATSYLNYLNKIKNINYLLTTHYIDLCKNLNANKKVTNYTMENKYYLQKGISSIKGGIKILEEQNFPEEIINTAKKIISLD